MKFIGNVSYEMDEILKNYFMYLWMNITYC